MGTCLAEDSLRAISMSVLPHQLLLLLQSEARLSDPHLALLGHAHVRRVAAITLRQWNGSQGAARLFEVVSLFGGNNSAMNTRLNILCVTQQHSCDSRTTFLIQFDLNVPRL